ncbi:YhdP family phospholipid transporter [Kushneria aurantia]|uniref:YhdP family protein n=1 Tax=Kushneria aurantia TaxID=504092 RepID=A0ABV6G4D1_9GAMM|nr:AsmA-like C-terminal region-containing protein [Kushneria aurantia]
MHWLRILVRWLLTLFAVLLSLLAALVLSLRLGVLDQSGVQQWLLSRAPLPQAWQMRWQHLSVELEGRELVVSVDNLLLEDDRGRRTLASVGQLDARLDLAASLTQRRPVIEGLDADRVRLDLYQFDAGGWGWQPSQSSSAQQGPDFSPERLTGWVETLLAQRLDINDARLRFHPLASETTPTLVARRAFVDSTGDERRLSLQLGWDDSDAPGFTLAGRFGASGALAGRLQLGVDARQALRLATLLAPSLPSRLEPGAIEGRLDLWGEWQSGELASSQLLIDVPRLALAAGEEQAELSGMRLAADLHRDENGGWRGALESGELRRDGRALRLLPEAASLEASPDFTRFALYTTGFELSPLSALADLLPVSDAELRRMLAQMSLQGRVGGLALSRDGDGPLHTRASLIDVSARPVKEIPGYGPISGWLEADDLDARLAFAGRDTQLAMPTVFLDPWQLESVAGTLTFSVADEGRILFAAERLRAQRRGASAEGTFKLVVPRSGPESFDLQLGFGGVDTDSPRDWLPVRAVDDPEVRQWLDGRIHRATIPEGELALHLVFNDDLPQAPDRDRVRVSLEARNAAFTFLEGWPPLTDVDGHLQLAGENLEANLTHARLLGLESHGARASLRDQRFRASALVTGNVGELLGVLQKAPLDNASLRQTLEQMGANGSLLAALSLSLPTDNPEAVTFDGDMRIDDTRFYAAPMDLTITDIAGRLGYHYRQQQSYIDGHLQGRAFEGPVRAEFDFPHGIAVSGEGEVAGVAGWLGLESITPLIFGRIDYRSEVDFGEGGTRIHATSPLTGLNMLLPTPFRKASGSELPLDLEVNVDAGAGDLRVGDLVRARWRHDSNQGQVWLENLPPQAEPTAWPDEEHWVIDWRPERLDVEAWQQAISRLASGSGENSLSRRPSAPAQQIAPIERVFVRTPCLVFKVGCLGHFAGLGVVRGDDWHIEADSSFMRGEVNWRDDPQLPIIAWVDWLDLTPFRRELARVDDNTPREASEPAAWPEGLAALSDGEIDIDRILLDGATVASLSGRWHTDDNGMQIDPLTLRMPDLDAGGRLVWESAGDERSLTRLRLDAQFGDLARTLAALGISDVIHTDSGSVETRMAWPGGPWQFDLEKANAGIGISLGPGRLAFIESRWANLVSLLNLDNLVRRLRLDFSDVTRSGVAFQSVDGRATLHDGVLETAEPVHVDGTATAFSVAGSVNLPAQQLDLDLGVTVPVSQSLPLAAVALGAPQVGGALYLLHLLFKPWIERVSQVHYNISGDWTSPQVKLDRSE